MRREDIRNIAIIAHVDHGKTTLVDEMLKQSGTFRSNETVAKCVMDSNDLERERGITILAKNTAVRYEDIKINIIDTPGHADFGGEVERILMMVDSVLLLVDSFEGCMPQTRFVLKKALGLKKTPIVVINKLDREGARPREVIDEILELFIELGATAEQLDFPVVYASGREGYATLDHNEKTDSMKELFEVIKQHVPPPQGEPDESLQILFSNIDYDEYIGRIGIGRVERGTVKSGQTVALCSANTTARITKLFQFEGLKRVAVETATMGDIVAVAGLTDLKIGETACDTDCVEPLDFVQIDEPTISVNLMVNNSPFAGKEGKFVTSRQIRDRLFKELETNVSLRVEETDSPDCFKISGRGELHLSILIETMRRQNFEFQISRPKVIFKEENGVNMEPMELLQIDVPTEYVGVVMEKIGARKGEMLDMCPDGQGGTKIEFNIPSRGLLGYRSELMTDTNGNGIMNSLFNGYEPYKGALSERPRGSIVAFETGETTAYGLFNAQDKGRLFIGAGVRVYEGMVVGENSRQEDLVVNVCKKKHITNIRAAGSDDALKLVTPVSLSLEQAMEFVADDELLEVTPENVRIRKAVLNKGQRARLK